MVVWVVVVHSNPSPDVQVSDSTSGYNLVRQSMCHRVPLQRALVAAHLLADILRVTVLRAQGRLKDLPLGARCHHATLAGPFVGTHLHA